MRLQQLYPGLLRPVLVAAFASLSFTAGAWAQSPIGNAWTFAPTDDSAFHFPFASSLDDWPPRPKALATPANNHDIITRLPPVDEITATTVDDPPPVPPAISDLSPLSSGVPREWLEDDSSAGNFEFSLAGLRRGTRYVYNKTYTGLLESASELYWDYRNYLSYRTLTVMAVSLGAAASLAETSADQHIVNWYQNDVRSHTTDVIARDFKLFGTGQYTIPIFLGAAFIGPFAEDLVPETGPIGQWGNRSMQAILVGGPAMLLMQEVLGSGRPTMGEGSQWQPFHHDNGVSGHAFMGSIFFLTAGSLSDNFAWKVAMFALSFGAGWSRINDNAHYASEVLMGWSMGWMAVDAVNRTKRGDDDFFFSLGPGMLPGGTPGIQLALRW